MVNVNTVYSGDYLKATDLQGRDVTVVIANAEVVKLDDGNKLCLYFSGKSKGLLVNKTNSTTISAIYGPETDNWIGKSITIGVSWVDFQGKQVEAIRVRPRILQPNGGVNYQAPAHQTVQQPVQAAQHPNAPGASRYGDLDDEVPFSPQVLG